MLKRDRICTVCGQPWELDYPGVGRPREICLVCQPPGLKVVRVSQVKLRKDSYKRRSEAGLRNESWRGGQRRRVGQDTGASRPARIEGGSVNLKRAYTVLPPRHSNS
jgi:hypothetical protein